MVDVFAAIVGMEAANAKWELHEKPFQQGNQEVFADAFDASDSPAIGSLRRPR
jgi:hypothetical protein